VPSAPCDPSISRLVSPETAVTRMRWARALAARVVPVTCLAA